MQSTFEKILKDGERKGYFRFHNDGAKIEYLPSGHKENLNDSEEKVRAEYYFDLIEKYGYPAKRLGVEIVIPRRTPNDKADIIVYKDDEHKNPYISDFVRETQHESASIEKPESVNIFRDFSRPVLGDRGRVPVTSRKCEHDC